MSGTRFNVALAARIDRSQKLASLWSKILEETSSSKSKLYVFSAV